MSIIAWERIVRSRYNRSSDLKGDLLMSKERDLVKSQDEEIRKLRQENARLKEERDILKKATFFARESR